MGQDFLVILGKKRRYLYGVAPSGDVTIGRDTGNRIKLLDQRASRNHCVIRRQEGGLFLEDLKSTNGTLYNGQPVAQAPLRPGDVVTVGETPIFYCRGEAAGEEGRVEARRASGGAGLAYCDACDVRLSDEETARRPAAEELAYFLCLACRKKEALPASSLKGYRLEETVYRVDGGAIFRAVQLSMHRPVAILLYDERKPGAADQIAGCTRRAKVGGKLVHPNIIQLYDCGSENGFYYLAKEFALGAPLSEKLRKEGPLTARPALEFAGAVASALAYAERMGIRHGTLTPERLFVAQGGIPKLMGFGTPAPEAGASGGDGRILQADLQAFGDILAVSLMGPARKKPIADPKLSALVSRLSSPGAEGGIPTFDALHTELMAWL